MPTQYPYPETGWSTGKMAKMGPMRDTGREFRELEGERKKKETKASEADYPKMSDEDWQKWLDMKPSHPSGHFYGSIDRDWGDLMQAPEGFITPDNHPNINTYKDMIDIFRIPGREKELFIRPKQQQTQEGVV